MPNMSDGDFAIMFARAKMKPDRIGVALLDVPLGFYLWDLMDAYPDHAVPFTVREVLHLFHTVLQVHWYLHCSSRT